MSLNDLNLETKSFLKPFDSLFFPIPQSEI